MKQTPFKIRQNVEYLRKKGFTYREISRALNISLGSAFLYSRTIVLSADQRNTIKKRSYSNSLGKLSNVQRLSASSKGGKRTALLLKPKFSRKELVEKLKNFSEKNHRLPTKRDFVANYRSYIRTFGTWNNAIRSVGFKPNPLRFSKPYLANDGHRCDSLAEKIIDDWLYARKISHLRNITYPNSRFRADFKINDSFIEFFGLIGQFAPYDKLVSKKREFIKKQKIKLISLYPNDLFPKFIIHKKLCRLIDQSDYNCIN